MAINMSKFAVFVSWMTNRFDRQLNYDDCHDLADNIDNLYEQKPQDCVQPAMVDELLAAMAHGKKIEAIKAYRSLTGEGLKEAKDAVEKYWVNQV